MPEVQQLLQQLREHRLVTEVELTVNTFIMSKKDECLRRNIKQ